MNDKGTVENLHLDFLEDISLKDAINALGRGALPAVVLMRYRNTVISEVIKTLTSEDRPMTDDTLARLDLIEKAIGKLAELQKLSQDECAANFEMIDDILEAHNECINMLVEDSPDLEMIYPEEEEEPKSATILTLVVDNTKDDDK